MDAPATQAAPMDGAQLLESIAREAEGMGQADAGQAGQPGANPAPQVTNASLLGGVFQTMRDTFCLVTKLESPARVFTDDDATKLGELWGAVADQYNVDLSKYLGGSMVAVLAVLQTVPVVNRISMAVRAELADRAKRQAEAAPAGLDEGQGAT